MINTSKNKIQFKHGMKPFNEDKYGRDLVYDDHRDESLVGDIPTSGGYKGKTTFGMMEMTNMGVVEKLVLIMDLFKPMLAGRVASFSTCKHIIRL